MEGGEDGVVDVLGRPAADMTAAMFFDRDDKPYLRPVSGAPVRPGAPGDPALGGSPALSEIPYTPRSS
jgi:hypothetical protein